MFDGNPTGDLITCTKANDPTYDDDCKQNCIPTTYGTCGLVNNACVRSVTGTAPVGNGAACPATEPCAAGDDGYDTCKIPCSLGTIETCELDGEETVCVPRYTGGTDAKFGGEACPPAKEACGPEDKGYINCKKNCNFTPGVCSMDGGKCMKKPVVATGGEAKFGGTPCPSATECVEGACDGCCVKRSH